MLCGWAVVEAMMMRLMMTKKWVEKKMKGQ
jgi:hypothetical protein